MRTTNTYIEKQVMRYMQHGYSLDSAIKQVDSLTLHRHPTALKAVKDKLKAKEAINHE